MHEYRYHTFISLGTLKQKANKQILSDMDLNTVDNINKDLQHAIIANATG